MTKKQYANHERTPERIAYERKHAKRFRHMHFRLDADYGEDFDRRREEQDVPVQKLLGALALGWTRMSDAGRDELTRIINERGDDKASYVIADALNHVATSKDQGDSE